MASNSVFVPYGVEDTDMYAVTMPNRSKKTTITLPPLKPWKVGKGHFPHRGGSGMHEVRRLKRLRTRADQQKAAALEE